jgi:hypothetical protein
MNKMGTVVHLEAFEAPIRGKRLRWFLTPGCPVAYPPGFQEQCFMESPAFQRKVLLSSHASSEAWKLVDRWDAILHPMSSADWSIAVAVVCNQPAPCFIVVTPEVKVPLAFFQKLQQAGQKIPTLLYFQTLALPLASIQITFDATFFPSSSAMEESVLEATQAVLQQTIPSDTLRNFVLKDAIRDLRSAGATLVVSSIEEQVPTLYWYYASRSKIEDKPLLSSIVQTLLLRG